MAKKKVELSASAQAIADIIVARDTLVEVLRDQFIEEGELMVSDLDGFYDLGVGTGNDLMELVSTAVIDETGEACAITRIMSSGNEESYRLIKVGSKAQAKKATEVKATKSKAKKVEEVEDDGYIYLQFNDIAEAEMAVDAIAEKLGDEDGTSVGISDADEGTLYVDAEKFNVAKKVLDKLVKAQEIGEYTPVTGGEDEDEDEEEVAPKAKGKKAKAVVVDDDWGDEEETEEEDEDEEEEEAPKAKGKKGVPEKSKAKGKGKPAAAAKPAAKGKPAKEEADPAVVEFDKLVKFLESLPPEAGKKRARDTMLAAVRNAGFVKSRKSRMKDVTELWLLTVFKGKQEDKATQLWEAVEAVM